MANDYSADVTAPRGIRDNNPGNEKVGIAWQGVVGSDGPFLQFKDISWGLRALAMDIANKITTDGLTTITDLVTKYAPPSENDTAAYIASVSADTGIGPDDTLSIDQSTLHALIRAIVNHENGDGPSQQYITDADIDQGIAMMGSNLVQLFRPG
jgi:hypothetical protein